MDSLFDRRTADALVDRIGRLTPDSERQWGTMSVAQMLAHCSVPFDQVYAEEYPHARPNRLVRALLRRLVKPTVVGPKPYKRNTRTAPAFVIDDERDFATEQARLSAYVRRAHGEGAAAFDGRDSHSFGPLTADEWSALFVKHTDHHLRQFGV